MGKTIPVYEVTVQTKSNGAMRVLTLEPGKHHVASLHGSRGYFESDEPIGYITVEGSPHD